MSVQAEIVVASPLWPQAEAEETVRRAIAASEALFEPTEAEVSVLLCDDAEIRRLNAQWRQKDSATNVLSFPSAAQHAGERHLGDIAIAFETLQREAADEGKVFSHHLAHLTVHGYLHLLGFDHESDEEAEEMEGLEREILAGLGIGDPYCVQPGDRLATR
ncbi:MAG TPA: rRNA maturation RNase YbeY [Rhodoblastus sp.]|nr:rRNA maturation RNase YbeY [Rhodoblastus sp.]